MFDLTKLVSRLENGAALPAKLYAKTGRAHIVGITGPPGVGKSSLIDRLIEEYRRQKKTVSVIAIDPTSRDYRRRAVGRSTADAAAQRRCRGVYPESRDT